MILNCKCGQQLEVDESLTTDEVLRESRLAEAEAWSIEHRKPGHGLYFNAPGIGSGGTPPPPRKDS